MQTFIRTFMHVWLYYRMNLGAANCTYINTLVVQKKVNGGTNMIIVKISRLSSNKFQNNERSALNSGQKTRDRPL